jgi:acyl carrier protein
MHDLTTRLTLIIRKYMADPTTRIDEATALADLGIDDLDLPMICLDLEDAYGPQIVLEANPATVGDLSARVIASLAERSLPRRQPVRRSSGWMSTGADRRR